MILLVEVSLNLAECIDFVSQQFVCGKTLADEIDAEAIVLVSCLTVNRPETDSTPIVKVCILNVDANLFGSGFIVNEVQKNGEKFYRKNGWNMFIARRRC